MFNAGGRGSGIGIDNCPHANTITDFSSGDEICVDCSLVLMERLPMIPQVKFHNDDDSWDTKQKEKRIFTSDSRVQSLPIPNRNRMVLYDFCSNANLPLKYGQMAYDLFSRVICEMKKKMDLVLHLYPMTRYFLLLCMSP